MCMYLHLVSRKKMDLCKYFLLILVPLVHGMNKDDFDKALPTMTVVRKFKPPFKISISGWAFNLNYFSSANLKVS